jgi:CheY-like chemotaxis protein
MTDNLEEQLQEALLRLHDPNYQPPASLYEITGSDPEYGVVSVQSAIIHEIELLRPPADAPIYGQARRIYDVMRHRYLERLTQEQTAELLNISVRSLNRVQREAIHTLVRVFWERSQRQEQAQAENTLSLKGHDSLSSQQEIDDWHTQAEQELEYLKAGSPDAISDVQKVVDGVMELEEVLIPQSTGGIEIGFIQPGLTAAIHPSVLRQILITAMSRLSRHRPSDNITIFGRLENAEVKIILSTFLAAGAVPGSKDLVDDILMPDHARITVDVEGNHVFLSLILPPVDRVTALVVDDNPQMVHFYRRATTGTRYHIVHCTRGQEVIPYVEKSPPDVIVLDVMLPDVDGWKLLMQLYENPDTRLIPVIVCSVVREADLALSLGAAHYLTKPVRPREFIQALEQVLARASSTATPR